MKLFTAAIAAKHKLTGDVHLKAGCIEAETTAAAEKAAFNACATKFPPSLYTEHHVNVQDIPDQMLRKAVARLDEAERRKVITPTS